ncbi:MAG: glycosyltransferase family 4 protein [Candidatus Delongbacteria bacterium]|nr:glycosyltransferase family 4 protein [Candidatus Delongbacteria bacterium]
MRSQRVKVLVIEHSLPYYHVPVWTEIACHPAIELTVAYGKGFFTGPNGVPEGCVNPEIGFDTVVEPSIMRKIVGKTLLWHQAALQELQQTRYDVVIHQFETKILSLWKVRRLQRKRGQRFVLWGIGESLHPTPVLDYVRRRLARRADALIFYAEQNRERYRKMGIEPGKLFVARNLIDIEPIKAAIKSWDTVRLSEFRADHRLEQGPLLLSVGRLSQRKRLDLLLKAVPKLLPDYPQLRVAIIGEGPEMTPLKTLADELAITDSVSFTGRISVEKEVAPWFLTADLVIAPGQIGHLATHAHAYGVPLITGNERNVQGPEIEILLQGDTGLTYEFGNVDALAAVICKLLADESRRKEMSLRAAARADEYCSVEKMAAGFIEAVLHVTNLEGGCEADYPES